MADGIKITFAQVSQTAGDIRGIGGSMRQILDQFSGDMRSLNSWDSDASRTLQERYNALAGKFEEFHTAVNNYAQFLDSTVGFYNEAEAKINSVASQFK